VPVFSAVVVVSASNIHIKNREKKKLITKLLGNTFRAIFIRSKRIKINGDIISAASENLSNVSENGFITPESSAEDMNDPATSAVTNKDKR